ncbi:MAG: FecR family protein, partial [Leptolinea sp.]
MTVHSPTRSWIHRLFAVLLILSLLLPAYTPVQAADDVLDLVKQFEKTVSSNTPGGNRDAALKVLEKYKEYQHLATAEKSLISQSTAKALDDHLITMCEETWRDVAVGQGDKLKHIVPVGTLGTRNDPKTKYNPRKSDKDFIPFGDGADKMQSEFSAKWKKNFPFEPESVGVNVLDPSKASTWPERVRTAVNSEKYNTPGGLKSLDNQLWKDQPNLWVPDKLSGEMRQVKYFEMVGHPEEMKAADAMGWASDNLRFRDEIMTNKNLSPAEMALKSSKYDIRTFEAFELAGGKLTAEQRALFEMTNKFRNLADKPLIDVVDELAKRSGKSSEEALRIYLEGMEELNKGMTRHIAETTLDMMQPGKITTKLTNDLAQALGNLPPGIRAEVEEQAAKKLGAAEFNEIQKLAKAYKIQVFRAVYFDKEAMKRFNKTYEALEPEQKALLHGADEAMESFAGKVFKAMGYAANGLFAGYAIYSAFEEGSKIGVKTGIASGVARAIIELLEFGYPPALAVEMVGRLAAGATNLGSSAYKNAVLNDLFTQYKEANNKDDVLKTIATLGLYDGGLRQMVIEMREEAKNRVPPVVLTDADIDKAIEEYFIKRLKTEQESEQSKIFIDQIEKWIHDEDFILFPDSLTTVHQDDLADEVEEDKELVAEYSKILALWMNKYDLIRAQLEKDKVPATPKNINYIVSRLLYFSHEDYIKAMNSQYAIGGKVFKAAPKPVGPQMHCTGIACLKWGVGATIQPITVPSNPGVIWAGGGSFKGKQYTYLCDPGGNFGPFPIAGAAKMKAAIKGSPSVPQTWSSHNYNTSLIVMFSSNLGDTAGAWEQLAALGGEVKDADLKQEFDVPAAGRLKIYINPPVGSGAAGGSECYAQGYSGKVEVVEMKATSIAQAGTTFHAGERITTANNQEVVMQMADGTKLDIDPNSVVFFDKDASGQPVVRLEKGRIHFTSPPQGGKPIVVIWGDKTITRKGTDFIVFDDGSSKGVSVIDGSVTVTSVDGTQTEVGKGKEMDLVTGSLKDYTNPDNSKTRFHNLRLGDLFIGDSVPEPEGSVTGPTTANPTDNGWVWQDPGYDSALEVSGGQVTMTVPYNKKRGGYGDNASVLIHKVSGDFDLQTQALLIYPINNSSNPVALDFIIYAPDSFLGINSKQESRGDSLFAHTRLVGAGWTRSWGKSMLKILAQRFSIGGQEVPDAPVLLRLTRRGDIFRTYWSIDSGSTWNLSAREQFDAPETLYTGWTSVYDGDAPGTTPKTSTTTLENISLTSAALNSLPQPDWDIVSAVGKSSVSGNSATLELDGTKTGETWAYRGEILTGDFEVIASFSAKPWTHQPGDSRSLNLLVDTVDNLKGVYVGAFKNDGYLPYMFQTQPFTNVGLDYQNQVRVAASGTSGKLRLVRKDGVITAFYESEDGQWVRIDKGYPVPLSEPVFSGLQINNTLYAKNPTAFMVDFTFEKISGQAAGSTTTSEDGKPAVPEAPAGPTAQVNPAVEEEFFAVKSNGSANNGATVPNKISIQESWLVKSITTYHWNAAKGVAVPGTISLKAASGKLYGPWKAIGTPGNGAVPNAYWTVKPG